MANTISMVNKYWRYEVINIEVIKILIIIDSEKYLYVIATLKGFGDRMYWAKFVTNIGIVSKGIAAVGSITSVSRAITVVGNPIPRNPFTIPATRNVDIKNTSIAGFVAGKNRFRYSVSNLSLQN